jgi:hypothetical protein
MFKYFCCLGVLLLLMACTPAAAETVTPTVDLNAYATRVAVQVFDQLTAIAGAVTPVRASATAAPAASATATSTSTPTPAAPTATLPAVDQLKLLIPYFLVNMTDAERCEFSLVAVSSIIYVGPDWRENIRMALNSLFSYKYPQYEITAPDYLLLTNALYSSNLVADDITFDGSSLNVYLGGELNRQNICTDVQMRNQIWATVQFFTNPRTDITEIIIWHNTDYLDDLLLPGG